MLLHPNSKHFFTDIGKSSKIHMEVSKRPQVVNITISKKTNARSN